MTLAIFKQIISKCKYKKALLQETSNYKEKIFIENRIIKQWLKTILDELVLKEHEEFDKNIGSSTRAFYTRATTWENIKKKLEALEFEKDEELKKIFNLDLSNTS